MTDSWMPINQVLPTPPRPGSREDRLFYELVETRKQVEKYKMALTDIKTILERI